MIYEQLKADLMASYANRFQNAALPNLKACIMLEDVPHHIQSLPHYSLKPIYEWMGLEIDYFPLANFRTEEQRDHLCLMFPQLFEFYNYWVDVPEDLVVEEICTFWLQLLRQEKVCYFCI